MKCSSHLAKCLESKGVIVTASASSAESGRGPSNALIYNTANDYCSLTQGKKQWWMIDFKRIIYLEKYEIASYSADNWIAGWNLLTSVDNSAWSTVDSPPNQWPNGKDFKLAKGSYCRYVRIDGYAPYAAGDKTVLAFYYAKFYGSIISGIVPKTCLPKRVNALGLIKFIILIIYS